MRSKNVLHSKNTKSINRSCGEVKNNAAEDKLLCSEDSRQKNILQEGIDNASNEDDGLDEGYCWVILLSGALLQLMSIGVTYSSGLLVVEFRDAFDASPALASLMGALNCGLAFGSGEQKCYSINSSSSYINY